MLRRVLSPQRMRASGCVCAVCFSVFCCAVVFVYAPKLICQLIGWRYASWLPSVSVQLAPPPDPRQLLFMTMQVRAMFPQFSASRLAEDLARSRSAHATVDNILEGRLLPDLIPPPTHPEPLRHFVVNLGLGRAARTAAAATATTAATAAAATDTQLDNSQGTETDLPPGTFSSLAAEREAALQRRKHAMVAAARRRFLERHPPS